MWYSHQIQPADSNFRERERERVIGHFFLGAGNVIIVGYLTLSNPCVSSYGYLAVIKIGQQLHQLEGSTYGSLPQLLLTSVLCGPVTLTILDITNNNSTLVIKSGQQIQLLRRSLVSTLLQIQ